MQPGVVAVKSGATVSELARIMRQKSVRGVFVMKEGKPIGLVRDRDIITRIVAYKHYPDLIKVDEIMYTPAPAVTLYAELSDVAAFMAESGVGTVLFTEGGRILGTITAASLKKMRRETWP